MSTEKDEELQRYIMERWFHPGTCWTCGEQGWWMEQVNGPANLRKVYCDCPFGMLARGEAAPKLDTAPRA